MWDYVSHAETVMSYVCVCELTYMPVSYTVMVTLTVFRPFIISQSVSQSQWNEEWNGEKEFVNVVCVGVHSIHKYHVLPSNIYQYNFYDI